MRRLLGPTHGTTLRRFFLTALIHPALTALQAKLIPTLLSFKDDGGYCALPSWLSQVQHVPSEDDLLQFDLSQIKPSIIKKVLRKHPSSSSPGDDGITYDHLNMMLSTHHFLATLFSKVLLCSQVPPTLWTDAKIIMIHKKGDTADPANFRPIVLTSVIGKLFHKTLANRHIT